MPSPNEYRALAEEAAGSVVAARASRIGTFVKVVVPAGAVLVAGWMIYSAMRAPDRPSITSTY